MSATVSIVRTASTLPDAVVSNRDIGERLVAGVPIDDEAGEDIVAKVRERSQLIEKKTGLRARRFFDPGESPVTVGLELLERLMAGDAWSGLDALIVSSSSTHGFPGVSQQIVAAARSPARGTRQPVRPRHRQQCLHELHVRGRHRFEHAPGDGLSPRRLPRDRVRVALHSLRSALLRHQHAVRGRGRRHAARQPTARRVATIRSMRASSMIDAASIGMIKGGGMQAADLALDVPKPIRWYMAGPPVAVGATRILVDEIRRYQAEGARIDWLIPHQANLTRILIPACEKTGIDPSRLCASFADTGNTSSASIPLLLDQLVRGDRVRPGEFALLIGFGSSFTIGSALVEFGARVALGAATKSP